MTFKVFSQCVLDKSVNKIFDEAIKEWIYIGQVKHLEKIQSTAKNEKQLNEYSIAFYNFKTNAILHTNTKNQYLIQPKGKSRQRVVITDPKGSGESDAINVRLITNINIFVKKVDFHHKQKNVEIQHIKRLLMYKYFIKDISIEEQDSLNKLFYDIEHLLTIYKINCCNMCNIEFLHKFNIPLCTTCFLNHNK